jgi:Ca2+:H+ antiporter
MFLPLKPDSPMTASMSDPGAHSTENEGVLRRHTAIDDHTSLTKLYNPERRKSTSDIHRQKMPFFPTLKRAATLMVVPEKSIAEAPNVWKSIRNIIFSSCEVNLSVYQLH